MLSKIFARRKAKDRKAEANDSQHLFEWNAHVKAQHDDMPKAGYIPIPEAILAASNTAYSDPKLQSMLIAMLRQCHRDFVHPIRLLFKTNVCLAIPEAAGASFFHSSPSIGIEEACAFKIDAMNAALETTPLDLLVLLDSISLPRAEEWRQDAAWIAREFPYEIDESKHSLYRHVRALFLKRIDTPPADFLAFREAAIALSYCRIFDEETDARGTRTYRVSYVAQDIFPWIKAHAGALLRRQEELVWRPADSDQGPVIPDHLIGVGGSPRDMSKESQGWTGQK